MTRPWGGTARLAATDAVDPQEVLRQADLGMAEVSRRAGGTPATGSVAVRRRFAALLGPVPSVDEPAPGTLPDDVSLCGALVVRLGQAATATAIATWMGWTLERTGAAVAEVDRRLHPVGLQLVAEAGGRLVIRDRVRVRVRPQRRPLELLGVLETPATATLSPTSCEAISAPRARTGSRHCSTWVPPCPPAIQGRIPARRWGRHSRVSAAVPIPSS